jgi:four helix bundle protein
MSGTSHRDLRVWQVAMTLANDCYTLARKLPREELFGMTFQIRKAAGSVPANIAEGYGRYTKKELIRYLNIANGSLVELDTHFELAVRAGYFSEGEVEPLQVRFKELGGMMHAFKAAVRRRPGGGPGDPGRA